MLGVRSFCIPACRTRGGYRSIVSPIFVFSFHFCGGLDCSTDRRSEGGFNSSKGENAGEAYSRQSGPSGRYILIEMIKTFAGLDSQNVKNIRFKHRLNSMLTRIVCGSLPSPSVVFLRLLLDFESLPPVSSSPTLSFARFRFSRNSRRTFSAPRTQAARLGVSLSNC